MSTNRQNVDRRNPDRRNAEPGFYNSEDRRNASRRGYVDRRNHEFWQFNWLRTTISHQLAA